MIRLFFLLCLLLSQSSPLAAAQNTTPLVPQNLPQKIAAPDNGVTALADIKEPVLIAEQPNLLFLGSAIIFGLLVLVGCWWIWRRRKHRVQRTPAHETALQRLAQAHKLIEEKQANDFVVLVGDTLKSYIEERFAISARNRTTREFIEQLTQNKTAMAGELVRHSEHLHTWLAQMDMVKFAGANLEEETMEHMLTNLQSFIRATAEEVK
jgi:hypothetical protein